MDWALPTDQVLAKVSPDPNAAGSSIKKANPIKDQIGQKELGDPSRLMCNRLPAGANRFDVANSFRQRSHANLCLLLATKISVAARLRSVAKHFRRSSASFPRT
jgi:hypothetical protein